MNITLSKTALRKLEGQVFTVSNDSKGWRFISSLRNQLKADGLRYKLRVYGRGPRAIHAHGDPYLKDKYIQDLPRHLAKSLAVNILRPSKSVYVNGKWMSVRTTNW